ncbi:MAG: guanylate kinase [Desulfobulbaceae bacterium]|uniref:Guanylate kinase n=1 Tax=Candidatus Desulfatifera sulfidica TaxID=2841691 RepID=A0A8J6N8S4_9BACT|nr:guanylate kinase [Candidatus Desulfatifera sulfidica]
MVQGRLFVFSAPSGAGKTTLLKRVMGELDNLVFSVSHTTRAPRSGEMDAVDYHFVSRERFEAMRDQEAFLEWAEVHGNFYGTSREAVLAQLEQGMDVILDIDVQGAAIIRASRLIDAAFVFISPPSLAELERRLRGRKTDSDETIGLRLKNAAQEMRAAVDYDYLLLNDQLEEAVMVLKSVILAERSRAHRLPSGGPIVLEGL